MKNILSFLACLGIAGVLAYEISGSGGIFVIFLLVTAFIVSAVIHVFTVKTVDIDLSVSSDIVNKGEDFEARLSVGKTNALPTGFIEVTIGLTPNIVSRRENMTYKFICLRRRGEVIDIPLNSALCGCGTISIEKIVFTDYFGMIKKTSKNIPESVDVKMLPRIPDTGSQTEVLKSTADNITFDDSDEESDESSSVLTGVPGYEHRPYEIGDPLKRVNWKLSSKKDQLMVRLDEKVTSSSQVFLLDYPEYEYMNKEHYQNADRIIEAALALMSMLLLSGYESEFNYFVDGWEMIEIKDEKSLIYLQERLAAIKPYPNEHRSPDHNINVKGKAMTCFTTCTSEMLKEISQLRDSFPGSLIVTQESGLDKLGGNIWTVNSDFEFARTQ